MNYTYTVAVINKDSSEPGKSIEAIGLSKAKKVASGIEINLNRDKYFVKITKND